MAYGKNAPFGLRPIMSNNGGSWSEKRTEYNIYASADGTSSYATTIFTGDPVTWGTSIANTPAANGLVGTIVRWNPGFQDAQLPATFSTVPVLGVFDGCEYKSITTGETIMSPIWPASTQVMPGTKIKAYVLDDPNTIFDIQVSSHINAAGNAFVGNPVFPNTNATGGGVFPKSGSFGRLFGLNVGGGTNFNSVINGATPITGAYANNPATGNVKTGQSAFYLDVDTSTAPDYNDHDYNKNVITLPLKVIGYSQNVQNIAGPGLTIATTPFINVRVLINNHALAAGSLAPVYVA